LGRAAAPGYHSSCVIDDADIGNPSNTDQPNDGDLNAE
jgi:hypothetical protein